MEPGTGRQVREGEGGELSALTQAAPCLWVSDKLGRKGDADFHSPRPERGAPEAVFPGSER